MIVLAAVLVIVNILINIIRLIHGFVRRWLSCIFGLAGVFWRNIGSGHELTRHLLVGLNLDLQPSLFPFIAFLGNFSILIILVELMDFILVNDALKG